MQGDMVVAFQAELFCHKDLICSENCDAPSYHQSGGMQEWRWQPPGDFTDGEFAS
ncbi:hypothetical protein GCM10022394_29540 [Zobellella aerophila]|uniref:Uncharacterized protein n=1 Tax=Zobellella aerophila TaxID=870480 RepID=A0ABP6W738_9GAMM